MACIVLEREDEERMEEERTRLQEMTEDEYDALSEAERKIVDEKRLVIKKERMKKCVLVFIVCSFEKM